MKVAGARHRESSGRYEFPSNMVHSMLAFVMWLGLLLVFMFLPDPHSKFGRSLSRYICKHLCSYFPITHHVEDMHAFHPDRACVFGYEPQSLLPIGVVTLAELTSFMPFSKMKVLASTAAFYAPALRHIWTWLGASPSSRYQYAAVFVNARLHVFGGALGGGRMVEDLSRVAVLDTAVGVWCDTKSVVTSPRIGRCSADPTGGNASV